MKVRWVVAGALGFAIAAGACSPSLAGATSKTQSAQEWSAQSRRDTCEASRKRCIAAHVRTGSFGVRGVSPEDTRRCWAAYRQCMGQ